MQKIIFLVLLFFQLELSANDFGPTFKKSEDWKKSPLWSSVSKLYNEQKFKAASVEAQKLLENFQKKNDEKNWALGLILRLNLKLSLGEVENALLEFKSSAWPKSFSSQFLLNLYYSIALREYYQVYSYEINQRESKNKVELKDLKSWTKEDLYKEIRKTLEGLWKDRAKLKDVESADLDLFVVQGSYPKEIRGTLRDTFIYFYSDTLADSSLWTAQELSLLNRQTIASYLDLEKSSNASESLHPLFKLSTILHEHSLWHEKRNNLGASLEAKIELVRKLRSHYSSKQQSEDLKNYLLKLSANEKYLKHSWWSELMYTLGLFYNEESGPTSKIKALELAEKGLKKYPESLGAQRCKHLISTIKAPSLTLESMKNDLPNKRSLTLRYKNWNKVYFRAYKFDPVERMLANPQDYSAVPGHRQWRDFLSKQPDASWSQELKPTPDYLEHQLHLTPPLKENGSYLIFLSALENFSESQNQINVTYFQQTELYPLKWYKEGLQEVQVVHAYNGEALSNVTGELYKLDWQKGHQLVKTFKMDKNGRYSFSRDNIIGYNYLLNFKADKDSYFDERQLSFAKEQKAKDELTTLIFTDRAVYRPKQKIYFKILSFSKNSDGLSSPQSKANQEVEVTLFDANQEKVQTIKLKTNSFATAHGEFEIPLGKILGKWRIASNHGYHQQTLKVEEYKRPTMKGEIADSKAQLTFGQKASFLLTAKYYYGQALRAGKVTYQIKRQADYSIFYFHRRSRFFSPPSQGEEEVVSTGTGALNQNGEYSIDFLLQKPSLQLGQERYRYLIEAEVLNEGGETLKLTKSFTVAKVNIEASWTLTRPHFFPDEKIINQKVLRRDLNGVARTGSGLWKLYQLKTPETPIYPADYHEPRPEAELAQYLHPDDLIRKRWEGLSLEQEILALRVTGDIIQQGALQHDKEGIANFDLAPLKPGEYRFTYTTKDEAGEEFSFEQNFTVLQAKANLPLVFVSDKNSALPGDSVKFFLSTPYKNQRIYYQVIHLGKVLASEEFHSEKMKNNFTFKVKKEHIGGLLFKVYLICDQTFLERSLTIDVPNHENQLSFEFTRLREILSPGTEEVISFKLNGKDSLGKKIALKEQAEVLASMYDQSLDLFAPLYRPSLDAFFPKTYEFLRLDHSTHYNQATGFAWNLVNYPSLPPLYGSRLELFDYHGIGGPGARGGAVGGMMLYEGSSSMDDRVLAPRSKAEFKDNAAPAKLEALKKGKESAAPTPTTTASSVAIDNSSLRSNFSETAFWMPQLIAQKNQDFEFRFKVPDSLTSWNFWLSVITKNLKFGSESKVLQTMKDFMVRTYLPRFFRQQDEVIFNVQVENHSKIDQEGKLLVSITDEADRPIENDFELSSEFIQGKVLKVAAGKNLSVDVKLKVPMRLGLIKVKVLMQTKEFSDGELKEISLLPSRVHLVESKFVALTKEQKSRVMKFDNMLLKDESRINEKFVITAEGQLFYSLLKALPYLMDYPYECTEQTLNRFVSTSMIAASMNRYPKLQNAMKLMSKRSSQFESFDEVDANRKTLMEETPWLQVSRGGAKESENTKLLNMLDPDVVRREEASSLSKLKKSQLASGAFPWFPGGPPSFYMTSYILYGFSKVSEFQGKVPEDLIKNAFSYVLEEYRQIKALCMSKASCFETITFLNFILSQYKDPKYYSHVFSESERKEMLDFSFAHWKKHSPQLKSMLALTLKRAKRDQEAILVLESILDSAKSDLDLGVYFAPEDRSWLWYNDTVETQAIFLRALSEVIPNHNYRSGLTQWLMLNKKMNHWKSTKATAEAIYSVLHYLTSEKMMEQDESIVVELGSLKKEIEFKNDEVEKTKAQLVFREKEIVPQNFKEVKVSSKGNSFNFVSANWHYSTQKAPLAPSGDMLSVSRRYFKRSSGNKVTLTEIKSGDTLEVGDQVEVHLSLRAKHEAEYVHLRDPRPAGMEPEKVTSGYLWDLGLIRYEEIKDSATNFFMEQLPVGEYTLKHRLRVNMKGKFFVGPATLQSIYAPEFNAYSSGFEAHVK